jgi:hypothetical protein
MALLFIFFQVDFDIYLEQVKRVIKTIYKSIYRSFLFCFTMIVFNIIAQSAGVNVNATIPERMIAVAIVIANCL